ncbi:restriction endonuclease subunit S [Streptomyces sp. 900105755]
MTAMVPGKFLFRPVDERAGTAELPLLSVSRYHGVVPRQELTDKLARAEDLSNYKVCQPRDIIVNRMSAYQGAIGMSPMPGLISPDYMVLRPGNRVESKYLHYLFRSAWFTGEVVQRLRGIGSVDLGNVRTPRINPDDFGAIEIPVPSMEEQRRIADFLDVETARIDQLTLKRRQMRSLLTLKRERVIESTLGLEREKTTDGLVPLKYVVADVTVGIVITPAKWYVETGGTPALRGLNVKPGFINTSDLVQISAEGHAENRKSRLNTGDVVVVRTGQTGAAAVVPAELDGANCIDLIVVRPGRNLSPRYLQYVLNSDYASARVTEHSVGSIQAHFNVGAMKQIPIPSIPRTEQDEIVRLLDVRVSALDLLHRKLDRQEQLLTEHRQALVTAAVTGQFDVSTASGRNVTDGVSA